PNSDLKNSLSEGQEWQGFFADDAARARGAGREVAGGRGIVAGSLLNPVRAGLINTPSRYRWSSAAAHARGRDDTVVRVGPLPELAPNRRAFLARVLREEDI